MNTAVIIVCSVLAGAAACYMLGRSTIRSLRQQIRKLRSANSSANPAVDRLSTHEKALYYKMLDDLESGKSGPQNHLEKKSILRSVTEFLFVTTQIFALGWVSISYGIAIYSTVVLMQPSPLETLSQQSIDTILKVVGLKVIGNIFEHNEGPVFGSSKHECDLPEEGGEGGVG